MKKLTSFRKKDHSPGKGRRSAAPRRTAAPLTLDIEKLTWGGRGLGHSEGKVIFVSKSVPGDKLLVRLDKVKSSYGEGHIEAVLSPSEDRVEPKCKFFSHCGGCQWLSTAYERQLAEKRALVTSNLRHLLDGVTLEEIEPAVPPTGYRHRADFHVKPSGGQVRIGFYQEASHQIVNLDTCRLFDGAFNEFYGALRRVLKEEPAARCLDGMTLVRSESEDHFALHLRTGERARQDDAVVLAEAAVGTGAGGCLVTPSIETGRVLVKRGSPRIEYGVDHPSSNRDIALRADVRSFTQPSYAMNRILVRRALEWLDPGRHERLLDLYSGVGNFSLPLATVCREVVAVESSPFANEDAKDNAGRNEVFNVKHLPGDVLEWSRKLAAASESFDAVLLDPPRTGARGLVEPLVYLRPKRILYVSCSLPSLERDLQDFHGAGYKLVRILPMDLFPQTYGVETLCLLKR
jgi:23S rRNA (uracil1939-C5)-methyltransferase